MTQPLIRVVGLGKSYETAAGLFPALIEVNLEVHAGEYLAIMGPSGSGKSTFMNLLGCLDTPTAGDYFLAGENVAHLGADALARLRNRTLGFVFQGFNLLPRMSLADNVALPLVYAGLGTEVRRARAQALLDKVGVGRYADSLPARISGGQQQRVAIARALVNSPRVLLADEPTGNLDSHTSEEIMRLFGELNGEGLTVVLVTHEADVAAHARRQVRFRDGRIVSDVATAAPAQTEAVPC
jgi:putative ABC transport system ATP-binding protein